MKKIFYIVFLLLATKNSQGFITKGIKYNNYKHRTTNKCKEIKCYAAINREIYLVEKMKNYNQLLRTVNIMPTFLLNFLGGWLIIPSYKLFLNKTFLLFSIITQLTMMNSMIINDLFDLKVDLINNKDRPLVTQKVTVKEAMCLYTVLNVVTIYLTNTYFHKTNLSLCIYCANLIVFLYTPLLKKILFIKNITCASIVSSTIFLTYKSLVHNSNLNLSLNIQPLINIHSYNNNANLVHILSKFLFISSLYIELLLDIKDMDGDKKSNIMTVPNYFGVKKTLNFLTVIFTGNLIYYSNFLYKNNKYTLLAGFLLANINFIKNLIILQFYSHSDDYIVRSVKDTTSSLVIFSFFFCCSLFFSCSRYLFL
jgi:4-hydroxybenzoate polyprenyltransferase